MKIHKICTLLLKKILLEFTEPVGFLWLVEKFKLWPVSQLSVAADDQQLLPEQNDDKHLAKQHFLKKYRH